MIIKSLWNENHDDKKNYIDKPGGVSVKLQYEWYEKPITNNSSIIGMEIISAELHFPANQIHT